ncbi:MAG: hypothetical protein R2710_22480 [Acidimicrobiales bacterium]
MTAPVDPAAPLAPAAHDTDQPVADGNDADRAARTSPASRRTTTQGSGRAASGSPVPPMP